MRIYILILFVFSCILNGQVVLENTDVICGDYDYVEWTIVGGDGEPCGFDIGGVADVEVPANGVFIGGTILEPCFVDSLLWACDDTIVLCKKIYSSGDSSVVCDTLINSDGKDNPNIWANNDTLDAPKGYCFEVDISVNDSSNAVCGVVSLVDTFNYVNIVSVTGSYPILTVCRDSIADFSLDYVIGCDDGVTVDTASVLSFSPVVNTSIECPSVFTFGDDAVDFSSSWTVATFYDASGAVVGVYPNTDFWVVSSTDIQFHSNVVCLALLALNPVYIVLS